MNQNSKAKLILIVDDEADIRTTLSRMLTMEGYAVVEAKDGRLAYAMLEKQNVDLILSDIRMPICDGLELLAQVRKTSPVPFILMTGFSEVMETQEAQRRGATDFILKPFRREELLAAIAVAINKPVVYSRSGPTESEASQNRDLEFCRLSIDEFIAGRVSLADIFVRLTDQKYVQVARAGSDLSLERIQAYKAKGLGYLYIRKSDFAKYIGLNLELSRIVSEKSKVSNDQKMRILKHTSEVMLQDVFINGVDREKLETSGALVEALVSTLSEDDELFKLLTLLQTHSDHLYAHSLGVSLYSVMVVKHLGWSSAPTLFKVAMGGLLHDIGKKEIAPEILEKPRQDHTQKEREIYESHPMRGKELLSLIRSVPDDVVQITMHHHENALGRGFPYRLLKSKIHPLAKLVAVVDEFCDLTVKSSTNVSPSTAHEALDRLYALKGHELDLGFLRSLMEIFNHPVPHGMPKAASV